MKKAVQIFCVLVTLLVGTAANAEGIRSCDPAGLPARCYYSANEVFAQAGTLWKETYTAHGRTINLTVEIITPDVEQVPILSITPHQATIPSQALQQSGGELQSNDAGRFLYVLSPNPMEPPAREIGARETLYPLSKLNDAAPYAEDNPLTLGECKARAEQLLEQAGFSECVFDLSKPCDARWNQGYALMTARMRAENKESRTYTGDPAGEQGYYWLCARQTLRGIPLWRDIRWVFRSFQIESTLDIGYMNIAMDCADGGFDLCVKAADEINMLEEDIPLCSFEKVKAAYEAAISEGCIRDADQLVFGYMIFRGENKANLFTFPCWILRCRYLDNYKKDERVFADGFAWQDSDEALMLVINAQTGEPINPYDKSSDRDRLPAYLTWQEVNPI